MVLGTGELQGGTVAATKVPACISYTEMVTLGEEQLG